MAELPRPTTNTVILQDPWRGRWLRFSDPQHIFTAERVSDVAAVLEAVEDAVATEGVTAVGYVGYEAAAAFDTALKTHAPDGFPLVWFGLYAAGEPVPAPVAPAVAAAPQAWTPSLTDEAYHDAVGRVRDYIAAGDTYQVNFSFRLRTEAPADPWALFCQMVGGQSAGYAAYVDTGDWVVCSASPELFFRLNGSDLVSRPMKGTRPRGRWPEEDVKCAGELQQSVKDRAENVMIVDMVRNDLGRIARTGSVNVLQLFDVERYPTVLQMTSTVHAETDAGLGEILGALFPAASITGAPKAHTMELIRELEDTPRRIYTGAIGFWGPDRQAQFNVAIRTALIERARGVAEYGVGGGVVWDSTQQGELEECYTKAAVLTASLPSFDLLESLLWVPQTGYLMRDKHVARLKASADYFGWRIDVAVVEQALADEAEGLTGAAHKVRLTVSADGTVAVSSGVLDELVQPYRVCLADRPVDAGDRFLFHKSTERTVYKQARLRHPQANDVLLWNQDGELTESTIANVVLELDGRMVTPPVRCGLLAGVYRAFLLESGTVSEAVVHRDDLARCTRVCLVNSVRGMWEGALINDG